MKGLGLPKIATSGPSGHAVSLNDFIISALLLLFGWYKPETFAEP